MAKINFFVSAKKMNPAPIYIRLIDGAKVDLIVNSKLVTDPGEWDEGARRPKVDTESFKKVSVKLIDLESKISKSLKELKEAGVNPTKEWLAEIVEQVTRPTSHKATNLNEYLSAFLSEARAGTRKNKAGMNFGAGTVKTMNNFKNAFGHFQGIYTDDEKAEIAKNNEKLRKSGRPEKKPRPYKPISFDDIDLVFYEKFKSFLVDEGYKPNTVGRHIKALKFFMKKSLDERLHTSRDFENRSVFVGINKEAFSIYLTNAELDKIYNLDLSDNKRMEMARDAFMCLAETALRVSDYGKIGLEIRRNNGVKLLHVTQTKTGDAVFIPLSTRLEQLLNKYSGRLPQIHDVYINKYIKIVSKQAGIDERITWEDEKFGKKYPRSAEKWQLVTCHSARRSACTNMYLAGIPAMDIMKISGHRTEASFMKYIRVTKEETALKLAKHPYFSNLRAV